MGLLSRKALTNLRLCYFITSNAVRIQLITAVDIYCYLLAVSKVGPLFEGRVQIRLTGQFLLSWAQRLHRFKSCDSLFNRRMGAK